MTASAGGPAGHGRHRATGRSRHRSGLLVGIALLALLATGYCYIAVAEPGRSDRVVQLIQPAAASPRATSAISQPSRISIPAIEVDSPLQALGRQADGTLQPPSQPMQAGWYAQGVLPGAAGAAVIGGRQDTGSGPAVFARLRDLRIGDVVVLRRQDDTSQSWMVQDVHAYPPTGLPAVAVFAGASVPELRLITMTGGSAASGGQLMVTALPA